MIAKNLKQLHKLVGEREDWICEYCETDFSYECYFNEKGVNVAVCAHHVTHVGADISKKFNPDVCRNICDSCHNAVHLGSIKEKPL